MTVAKGNTIPPPPRLTGDAKGDAAMTQRWLNQLYDNLVRGLNVGGTLKDHEARIAALEAASADHEKRIKALE